MKFDYFAEFYKEFGLGIRALNEEKAREIFEYNFGELALKKNNGDDNYTIYKLKDVNNGWKEYEIHFYLDLDEDRDYTYIHSPICSNYNETPKVRFDNNMMFAKFGRMYGDLSSFTKMYISGNDLFIEKALIELDPIMHIEIYKDVVDYFRRDLKMEEISFEDFNNFKNILEENRIVPDAEINVQRFHDENKKDIYSIGASVNGIPMERYEEKQMYGLSGGYKQYTHAAVFAHDCYKKRIAPLLEMSKDEQIETIGKSL